ncbi:hypothetical protein [Halorussus pelagicus]|uniref:hypothetical protein n=1 Tax=Halorussus pelagicus TaxID=2505977 RepID=UPI000FFC5752|nr:hypothetical protein [Halorussus pelagicus]
MASDTELTDAELERIQRASIQYQTEIDTAHVRELLEETSPDLLDGLSGVTAYNRLPPEEQLAREIQFFRACEADPNTRPDDPAFLFTKMTVEQGISTITVYDEYHRFEPCVDKVFKLDDDQIADLHSYITAFKDSDYYTTLRQDTQPFLEHFPKWNPANLTADNVLFGKKLYESVVNICERGFPNLLAMKRVLDGERPENEPLQRKRATSVRRELTDTDNMNAVYFDFIVKKFDPRLRNGIAHGDLLNETTQQEVRIPTEDWSYSYEEFNKVITANIANALFLTGTFMALVDWEFQMRQFDESGRDTLEL